MTVLIKRSKPFASSIGARVAVCGARTCSKRIDQKKKKEKNQSFRETLKNGFIQFLRFITLQNFPYARRARDECSRSYSAHKTR